jgi:hypothetical protein
MKVSSVISEQAVRYKASGSRQFAEGDFGSALDSYQSALACLPDDLVWPEEERFALALYSNLALCALKQLDHPQPRKAMKFCQKARALPVFQVNASEDIRQKVYARTVEAMLNCREQEQETNDDTIRKCHPSREEIWSILDDARLRGYLGGKNKHVSRAMRKKFLQLGGRLHNNGPQNHGSCLAEDGLAAWTNHLVRKGVVSETDANTARKQHILSLDGMSDLKKKEREALALLDSLIPTPSIKIGDLCRATVSLVMDGDPPEEATMYLRDSLRYNHLHPCSVAEDGVGHLMWAICLGLNNSEYGNKFSIETFLALLSMLVDEFGVAVDQRSSIGESSSRNPFQLVVKYGHPRPVRAMLDGGANVNLKDDQGFTAIAAICMRHVKVTNEEDRIETAQLLLHAGADVNVVSTTGFTPLLSLCSRPCPKIFALLLEKGANPNHKTNQGVGVIGVLRNFGKENPEVFAECRRLLEMGSSTLVGPR